MKTYEVRQKYQHLDQDEPSMDVRICGGMDYDEARMYVNIVIEEDFQVLGWEYEEFLYVGSDIFQCESNGSYFVILEEVKDDEE